MPRPSTARVRRHLDAVAAQLDRLEAAAETHENYTLRAPSVSHWSLGQQLHHLAVADVGCLRAAAELTAGTREDAAAEGGPTGIGRLVLWTGWIPRGRGRAPKSTRPLDEPTPADLSELLPEGRRLLADLSGAPESVVAASGRVSHPVLGAFTAAQWLRFTDIHLRHHLRIVAEILRARNQGQDTH